MKFGQHRGEESLKEYLIVPFRESSVSTVTPVIVLTGQRVGGHHTSLSHASHLGIDFHPRGQDSEALSSPKAWFAIRVKRHLESTVTSHLRQNGFVAVLPMCRVRRTWSDRTKTVDVPLFAGYVFCEFNPSNRLQVEYLPGVNGIVSFGSALAEIDRTEMSAIQSVLASGLEVAPWPSLEPGRKVEIHRGPLRGLTGVVVGDSNNHRLILAVTLLNRSVSVALDRGWFRSVS